MPFSPFGIFAMRASIAWRYRVFGTIPGGIGALVFLQMTEPYWVLQSHNYILFVIFAYATFAFIFIPYAVWAIDKTIGFLMGDNLLVFDGVFFLLMKIIKYALAGFFLPVLVPIGMLYVRNENLYAYGQIEAQEMLEQQAEQERQKAEEAVELARRTEIREEAMKLAKEMKRAENDLRDS